MSKRAEALARELVRLSLKYTEVEFTEAIELIGSGPLFEPVRKAATKLPTKKRKQAALPVSQLSIADFDQQTRKVVTPIIDRVNAEQRKVLLEFLIDIEQGRVLPNVQRLRQAVNALRQQAAPREWRREDLLVFLFSTLVEQDEEARLRTITSFERRSSSESALKRWSQLIVKNTDG